MGQFYSFEDFQSTGVDTDKLQAVLGDECIGNIGRVYLGKLWIEKFEDGQWFTIAEDYNEFVGHDLPRLERALYNFAIAEGFFDDLSSTDDLADALADYCKAEGLPEQCAMELLHEDLTPEQRAWLSDFVLMWDAIEKNEDLEQALIARGESI